MKIIGTFFTAAWLLSGGVALAELPQATEEPSASSAEPTQSSEPKVVATLGDHELPKLLITWNCGACEQNEKVPPLIEKEYSDYATAHGYRVSESEAAGVEIAKYHQRPPAARAMLGAFAGKDTLGVQVTFRGDKFVASDYNANAWFGMNDLCRSVAQKSAERISAKLHNK